MIPKHHGEYCCVDLLASSSLISPSRMISCSSLEPLPLYGLLVEAGMGNVALKPDQTRRDQITRNETRDGSVRSDLKSLDSIQESRRCPDPRTKHAMCFYHWRRRESEETGRQGGRRAREACAVFTFALSFPHQAGEGAERRREE